MNKKVFIGPIPNSTIKSQTIKQFVEDLKYSILLKFGENSIDFLDTDTNSDYRVYVVPVSKKIEKSEIGSETFYINFSENKLSYRSKFYVDLSKYLEKPDELNEQTIYWNAITDIVFHLDLANHSGEKKKAFVADASLDQLENRKSIVRELEQHGFTILPKHPFGKNSSDEIKKALNLADFSIHIIGEDELPSDQGEEKDLVFLQNELASGHSSKNKDFNRFIYIPSTLNPPKSQLVKIEKVKRKPANLIGAEIIESGLEKFKSEMFQKINKTIVKHEVVDMKGNLLYIINGINYKTETKKIRAQLESTSLDLIAIDSFNDSLDFLHQHKANLLQASSILIINSEENNHWLSSMLDDVLKSYGFGKQRAFDLVGIISQQKLQYFSQMELINFVEMNDSTSKPSEETLRTFLKTIMNARS